MVSTYSTAETNVLYGRHRETFTLTDVCTGEKTSTPSNEEKGASGSSGSSTTCTGTVTTFCYSVFVLRVLACRLHVMDLVCGGIKNVALGS